MTIGTLEAYRVKWADTIEIDSIEEVLRDEEFDDPKYRSGGARLHYRQAASVLEGVKGGILLEVGFDDVASNEALILAHGLMIMPRSVLYP